MDCFLFVTLVYTDATGAGQRKEITVRSNNLAMPQNKGEKENGKIHKGT